MLHPPPLPTTTQLPLKVSPMLQCPHKILSMQRWPKSSDLPTTLSVEDQLNALCLGSTLAVGKAEAALIHSGRNVKAVIHCGLVL